VDAAAVRPLRLRVLRAGGAPADTIWPGDDDPAAAHLAIDDVAVATVVPEPHPVAPRPGDWRIRGMATAPEARGRGHGAALVDACLAHARERGGGRVWLHARIAAVPLYERAGFTAETGEFDVPGIGPHVRMSRAL
jgi:ribosomal protein S18 acetylase RimI-like enzyme